MKFKIEDILLYFGWTIIIIVTVYLFLKIFGLAKSPSLEEILISLIIGHSMILGIHQTKISYTEKKISHIENQTKRIERKIDRLLKKY
jgi:peptidoglycan hydrolase CwlO-like protein